MLPPEVTKSRDSDIMLSPDVTKSLDVTVSRKVIMSRDTDPSRVPATDTKSLMLPLQMLRI